LSSLLFVSQTGVLGRCNSQDLMALGPAGTIRVGSCPSGTQNYKWIIVGGSSSFESCWTIRVRSFPVGPKIVMFFLFLFIRVLDPKSHWILPVQDLIGCWVMHSAEPRGILGLALGINKINSVCKDYISWSRGN